MSYRKVEGPVTWPTTFPLSRISLTQAHIYRGETFIRIFLAQVHICRGEQVNLKLFMFILVSYKMETKILNTCSSMHKHHGSMKWMWAKYFRQRGSDVSMVNWLYSRLIDRSEQLGLSIYRIAVRTLRVAGKPYSIFSWKDGLISSPQGIPFSLSRSFGEELSWAPCRGTFSWQGIFGDPGSTTQINRTVMHAFLHSIARILGQSHPMVSIDSVYIATSARH